MTSFRWLESKNSDKDQINMDLTALMDLKFWQLRLRFLF